VSAYFIPVQGNYGTVTTLQTSVTAFYDDQYFYPPIGVKYSAQLRNTGDSPVLVSLNIGNFE
jgi:hypothetical protein